MAFDVYQSLVNRPYFLRLVMLETTFFFMFITSRGTLELLKHSGQDTNLKNWNEGLRFYLGETDLYAKSAKIISIFALDFHPWQHDNRVMAEQLKRKYQII